jgi:hypothetical protein
MKITSIVARYLLAADTIDLVADDRMQRQQSI